MPKLPVQLRERKSAIDYKEPATPPVSPHITTFEGRPLATPPAFPHIPTSGGRAEVSLSDPPTHKQWAALFEEKMLQQFENMRKSLDDRFEEVRDKFDEMNEKMQHYLQFSSPTKIQ